MSDPFAEYIFTPGVIASLTELTPELQRNYRNRDMLEGFGESDDSGRWKYCLRDLVAFWISDRLSWNGRSMDRRVSLRFGQSLANDVINMALSHKRGMPLNGRRFAMTYNNGHQVDGGAIGMSAGFALSLSEVDDVDFDNMSVINIHHLARTVPVTILGLIESAANRQFQELGLTHLSEGLDD